MTTVPRRTTHDGIDQSVPSSAYLPTARANMATRVYDEERQAWVTRDMTREQWIPDAGYIPFEYDFARHGGAIGDIELCAIPAGFVVLDGMIDVITALENDAEAADPAQIALAIEAPEDVLAADEIDTVGSEGLHDIVPDGTASNAAKATQDRQLTLSISVSDLTAGKLRGVLRGFVSSVE